MVLRGFDTAATLPGHDDRAKIRQACCARVGCFRKPTQAFDIYSWFRPQEKQTPRHYEVCDKHAAEYFDRPLDRDRGDRVKRNLTEREQARKVVLVP